MGQNLFFVIWGPSLGNICPASASAGLSRKGVEAGGELDTALLQWGLLQGKMVLHFLITLSPQCLRLPRKCCWILGTVQLWQTLSFPLCDVQAQVWNSHQAEPEKAADLRAAWLWLYQLSVSWLWSFSCSQCIFIGCQRLPWAVVKGWFVVLAISKYKGSVNEIAALFCAYNCDLD